MPHSKLLTADILKSSHELGGHDTYNSQEADIKVKSQVLEAGFSGISTTIHNSKSCRLPNLYNHHRAQSAAYRLDPYHLSKISVTTELQAVTLHQSSRSVHVTATQAYAARTVQSSDPP